MARAGAVRSYTSPHADITQRAMQRRPCRLPLPMPTLLTTCTRMTGRVTCKPCGGATRAEERGNRLWANCQCEMAHGTEQRTNARASTPVFTRYATLLQATKDCRWQRLFAAKCNSGILQAIKQTNSSTYINALLLQHHPYHLCYDEHTHVHGGSAPGREDTGWTLSWLWIRS